MTTAISSAAGRGAKAVVRVDGQHVRVGRRLCDQGGMVCAVLVPEGKIAMGKLSQAIAHGAKLLQVDGNFDDCLIAARKLAEAYPVELVNSVNPDRIEGQKTGAFEIVDALGDAPDIHALPVGNAGNITAYWKGFREYAGLGSPDAPGRARRSLDQDSRHVGLPGCGLGADRRGHPITHPRRSRPRSASATRRPGRRPRPPATSRAVSSRP
ncbi:pyridoxal-phosphate dependent enzyme [Oerskovia sp. M15]